MKFLFLLLIESFLFLLIYCNKNLNSNSNNLGKFLTTKANMNLKSTSQFKSLFSLDLSNLTSKKVKNINNLKTEERYQGLPLVTVDTSIDIGSGPFYYRGWNKYFTVKGSDSSQLNNFNFNPSYKQEQKVDFKARHAKESVSLDLKIPDATHFYFVLTDEYMNTISSRYNDIAKTVDILELKSLYDVKVDKTGTTKGGIEDLGNFKEGFCFVLRGFKKSVGSKFKWVICTDDFEAKCELMKRLTVLRLRAQMKCDSNNNKEERNEMTAITNIKLGFEGKVKEGNNNSTFISRWINLQDWSSCTLACGGGTQTLHRYCMRAPNGALCEGEEIQTRPCNTQPCMNVTDDIADVKLLPTEIRMVPVSLRPQKYRKCELKEEDLDIVRYDIANLKIPPRIPSRVVMNNRTISIFESGTYDSILASYYLNELRVLQRYEEDPKRCLKIGNSHAKFTVLCIMCNDNSQAENRINGWIKDIKDFRFGCQKKGAFKKITPDDPRLARLMRQLEEEDMRKNIFLQKVMEKKRVDQEHQKALKMAHIIAIRTLAKESKYEERIEQEEMMREQKEDEEIKNELLCEERKRANLLKALVDKRDAGSKKEVTLKRKLEDIEKELKKKVMENRLKISKKIKLMKMTHERKKNQYRQQITDIRRTLTQNVISAERRGDERKCLESVQNNVLERYCNVNFNSDPTSHADCKDKEFFCDMCCENEFGDLHLKEREKCTLKCEKLIEEKKNDPIANYGKGAWKFVIDNSATIAKETEEVNKLPGSYNDFNLADQIKILEKY